MISHCTIVKQNGQIILTCDVDGHRVVVFNKNMRNAILSGQSVNFTPTDLNLEQIAWKKS